MNAQKSKPEQSRELAQKVQDFLQSGGEVQQVPSGVSGNADNSNLFRQGHSIDPRSERTPLTEVVKTLEARKQGKEQESPPKTKKPQKRLIVDDFGDPVRWVWDE
ncbi:hypothetical protein [Agaribacterium haliotis]|uniref:hypothetical protein n=1 Tax=Agaribacterium haliotis TaxID=2013869 RepID=UPI000BB5973A|nr:hypothetical protein [Agaribacterium haliotis]